MRRRLFLVSVLGLLGLASLISVVILSLPPPAVTRRLPDGRELTLEGVTYGKARFHLIKGGGVTKRLLGVLPGWLLERTGLSTEVFGCDEPDEMVFWVTNQGTLWGA